MKKCSKCKIEKPAGEFHKDPRYKGGTKSYCKLCENIYSKDSARRISLAKKPICRRDGCRKKVVLGRQFFCSKKCALKTWSKDAWQKLKADPNYKLYRRIKAREWARRNRVSKTD